MEHEEWRPVARYEGYYEVSSHGRLRRADTGQMLRPTRTARGLVIKLSKEGKATTQPVAQLVAKAFLSLSAHGQLTHRDGNHLNCRADNLAYQQVPPRSHAKLNFDQVRAIRAETDLTQRQIADKYGISQSQVGKIRRGEDWRI